LPTRWKRNKTQKLVRQACLSCNLEEREALSLLDVSSIFPLWCFVLPDTQVPSSQNPSHPSCFCTVSPSYPSVASMILLQCLD
jgi:hypothetical protein